MRHTFPGLTQGPRFCGHACRQAEYRKRERAKKTGGTSATGPPDLGDLHEELRELALDGQDEMRHLVRLLANCEDASGDADGDSFEGPAAVLFEVELAFFGFASAHRMDIPVGVRTTNRRRPQKNRESKARYPYPAQPAMFDRFTVGRERPHR